MSDRRSSSPCIDQGGRVALRIAVRLKDGDSGTIASDRPAFHQAGRERPKLEESPNNHRRAFRRRRVSTTLPFDLDPPEEPARGRRAANVRVF